MAKHPAQKPPSPPSARVKVFMRLARAPREGWHRSREGAGAARLMQFLRIARGRSY